MTAKKSAPPPDVSGREMVITRIFDFPREKVFDAVADPKQVVKWWGPRGFTTTSDQREFKPGGVWRHVMVGPDGVRYPNLARYEEIVRPEKIVYNHGGGKEDGGDGVSFRSTWTFTDLGDGRTEVTMRGVFATAAMYETAVKVYRAVEGGRQTLARLSEHLAGDFVLTRLFDAPRDRVFKAWTEPERLAAWFGPKGVKTISARMDFRVGGTYHYGLRTPEGKDMWGKWTFLEIAAPESLVFVSAFSDEKGGVTRHPLSPTWPLETHSTILFQEMGDRTLLTVKWAPLNPTDAERATFEGAREGMMTGWGGTMEQFTSYLKENRG